MAGRRDPHTFLLASGGEANGASERIITRHLKNVVIQISGTFVADVAVEIRLAPTLPFVEIGSVSGPSIIAFPNDAPAHDARIVVANYVSGTVSALLAGRTAQE